MYWDIDIGACYIACLGDYFVIFVFLEAKGQRTKVPMGLGYAWTLDYGRKEGRSLVREGWRCGVE